MFKAKQATCHHVRSAQAGTKRCTQIQRLPLKDLSTGQLAQRRRDMAKAEAKAEAQAKAAAPRASAQPDIAEPSQCGFSTIEYALTAVRHPDRFTSCSDNLWVAVNWEVTSTPPFVILQGIFFWEDQQWTSYSATSSSWTHGMLAFGYIEEPAAT